MLCISGSSTGQAIRITGITWVGGSSEGVPIDSSWQVNGPTHNLRIDHNHFNDQSYAAMPVRVYGDVNGVADHNFFDVPSGTDVEDVGAFNSGPGDGYGDASWASPTGWGSSNFYFVEDNYTTGGELSDCYNGGRIVDRYNTFSTSVNYTAVVVIHETGGGAGRERGCRAAEVYHNYFTNTNSGESYSAIAGAAAELVWQNTVAGYFQNVVTSNIVRADPGHQTSAPPNNWGGCGSTTYPGTAWDGEENTSTGYPCLDQPGRGETQQALNGEAFPDALNSVTGTIAWPQQLLEPIYVFDNSVGGVTSDDWQTNLGDISANRDVYFDCGSANSACSGGFTGAAGTGYGTLASRPSSCTPGLGGTFGKSPTGSYGVGYWATDQNSGNGELYACSSTNNWTSVYTPYTYPHPLQSGGGGDGTVSISPSSNNFGSVNVGSSSGNVTFTVTNGSSASVTSASVGITGTNASYFSNTAGGTCGSTLASMASCTIIVKFSPAAAGSGFTATLTYSYSGGDGGGSVSAGLSGTGVSSCSSPVTVNAYTVCSNAFNEASSGTTSVSVGLTPYAGNGVEVLSVICGTSNCGAVATQTLTIGDNVNSPETCFTESPHSPYQSSNSFVPDYPYIVAWYCPSIPAGVNTITVTSSATAYAFTVNVQEIKSGQIASSGYFESVDQVQNSGNIANTTASISTSGTTANAADLITALVVNCGGNINASVGSGYAGITVNPSSDPGWVLEDMGVNATGTQTATTTWSSGTPYGPCGLSQPAPNDTWWGVIVPLKGASSTPSLNAPVISPASGAYSSPASVSITGPSGATICYTTDGSTPAASSSGTCSHGSTYSASFGVVIPSTGATVQALATESGYANSSVASVSYTLVACSNTSLGAGWTCVTSAGSSISTSGTSLSLGQFLINPPTGALIVVTGFNGSNAGCAAPSDSLVPSGNWHQFTTATVSADSLQLCGYWGIATSTGTDTVTWNAAANAASMGGAAVVYTSPSGTLSLDKTCSNSNAASGSGSNNAACSSGYTNSGANELNVFASYGDYSATVTAGTNYTLVNAPASLRDEYYMQASAGAITPAETISSSLNYGAVGASFESGSAPAAPAPPTALMATPN